MLYNIQEIRKAYELNYKQICKVIEIMGGQKYLSMHRINKTDLYLKLLKFQKKEHILDKMENNYIDFNTVSSEFELYNHA